MAITGTNGKTSTKEMLAAVLGTRYRIYATRANLNNLVGVPLTILEAPADTEALVVEAGANLPGEIARYREIIEPTITIVTNAVAGHLEGFGSLAGVVAEKLVADRRACRSPSWAREPPELAAGRAQAGARGSGRRRSSARTSTPDRVELGPDARPVLTFGGATLHAGRPRPAPGRQRDPGVGRGRGARARPRRRRRGRWRASRLPGGRGELVEAGGLTILNDCYNANPQSFRAAIATARALRNGRRLVFVAGTMRELGADAPALHAEIARALVELEPDLLGAVGDFVPALAPYAGGSATAWSPPPIRWRWARCSPRGSRGDEVVVLKASRGVALERILPALTVRATPRR